MKHIKITPTAYVKADDILLVTDYNYSSVVRRVRKMKRENDEALFDLTNGKKTLSVLFLTNGNVILSATSTETINNRIEKGGDEA